MMLSFWTDAVVAVLLVATIGYSVVLNRRLSAMRSDRDKFEDVIRNLTTASQRAEAAVANLRTSADDLGKRLDKKIDEARSLSDDLVYMIERGGTIADKMADLIRTGRDGLKSDPKPEVRPEPKPVLKAEHNVEAFVRRPSRVEATRPVPVRSETFQVEPRPAAASAPRPVAAPLRPEPASATSRAERELLRALSRRR
jgi:hypothetical protein